MRHAFALARFPGPPDAVWTGQNFCWRSPGQGGGKKERRQESGAKKERRLRGAATRWDGREAAARAAAGP